jgi:hypothetical protein
MSTTLEKPTPKRARKATTLAEQLAEAERRTADAKRRMDEAIEIFAGRIADGSKTVYYPDGTTCTAWATASQRYIDRTVNTYECEAWSLDDLQAKLAA